MRAPEKYPDPSRVTLRPAGGKPMGEHPLDADIAGADLDFADHPLVRRQVFTKAFYRV
jgi:hypothetical protein